MAYADDILEADQARLIAERDALAMEISQGELKLDSARKNLDRTDRKIADLTAARAKLATREPIVAAVVT